MTNMPVEEVRLSFEVIISVLILQKARLVCFSSAGCCEGGDKQFLVLLGVSWECMQSKADADTVNTPHTEGSAFLHLSFELSAVM